MKIINTIKEILEQGKFEGNIYKLPDIQLDRKDYQEVNKVLISLGGKWKTRVGHIFTGTQEELEGALFEVLEKGETTTLDEIKKQFQYFPTPKELAKELVELAEIQNGNFILEPSAGQGAILDQIIKTEKEIDIFAIELNKDNYKVLMDNYLIRQIKNTDFMEYNGTTINSNGQQKELKSFDKIIANPPFSKNQDVKHILHMYDLLEEGGRLVSIASSSIQTKETKYHKELMELNPEFIAVDEGAFKESGTMVNTVIVVINK